MATTLMLSGGAEATVDESDAANLSRWKWKLHVGGYACRSTIVGRKYVTVLMHRAVLGEPAGHVHHINGNKLDNRRENLEALPEAAHLRQHVGHLVAYARRVQIYPDFKACAFCGEQFMVNRRKRKRHKCCSSACAAAMRIAGRKAQAASSHMSSRK